MKVELGIAKGKKLHDKRQSIEEKDWKRDQGRLISQGLIPRSPAS